MFAEPMMYVLNLSGSFGLGNSETNDLEVPLPDDVPTELEVAGDVSSETSQEVGPIENIIIDTSEYVEFADGLPDHLINVFGLIKDIGSMSKLFFWLLSKPVCI